MEKKFNDYGVLITVLSLLMILVYGENSYDSWDLVLSGTAFLFGWKFIRSEAEKDKFSAALGSLICALGFSILVVSLLSVTILPEVNKIVDRGFSVGSVSLPDVSWMFVASMFLAAITYGILVKNRK